MEQNNALYQCLNIVRVADNMEPLRKYIKDQREYSRDRLETLNGEAFLVEQGRARAYKELNELIENALKYLEKIENSRRP